MYVLIYQTWQCISFVYCGQESKPQTRHVMSTLTEFPPLVTQLITLEIYPIAQATLSIE